MGYSTVYKDFIFVEGDEIFERSLGVVKSDLSFTFGAQLKNLNDVKESLMIQSKALGANALIQFKYGQKSRWLAIDDVAFYGEGIAVVMNEEMISNILEKIKKRG